MRAAENLGRFTCDPDDACATITTTVYVTAAPTQILGLAITGTTPRTLLMIALACITAGFALQSARPRHR